MHKLTNHCKLYSGEPVPIPEAKMMSMLKNACRTEPKPGDPAYEKYVNEALSRDFADGAYGLYSFATFPIPPSTHRYSYG